MSLERVTLDVCSTCLYWASGTNSLLYRRHACATSGCAFTGDQSLAHEVKLGHHLTPEDSVKFVELVQAVAAHLRDDVCHVSCPCCGRRPSCRLSPSAVRLREALRDIAGYDLAAVGGVGASSPDAPDGHGSKETRLGGSDSRPPWFPPDAPTALADVGGTGEGHPGYASRASANTWVERGSPEVAWNAETQDVDPVGRAQASAGGPSPVPPTSSHAQPAVVSTTPPAAGASGGGAPLCKHCGNTKAEHRGPLFRHRYEASA